ncbi:MAG: FKBP-type peptidyl-prolyl cis-trans isomerase [Bacteroidetes bacterium]|nr:FKBP-type peptidyl-prolyl cis-trans isomerase [Bacteroidota bacterium]
MKKIKIVWAAISIALVFTVGSCDKKNKSTGNADLSTLKDSFSFAAGFNYGLQLKERELTDLNFDALIAGMKEAFFKDSGWIITPDLYEDIVKRHLAIVQEASSEKNIKESADFISKKSSEKGVQKTETGLLWKVIKEGEGANPNITDTVVIHLRVELPDGKVFEDTKDMVDPIEVPVSAAWPGMVEGLQMMRPGAIYEFYVPYELGFGKNPQLRGMPPNKALMYRIEMFDIK